MRVYYDRDCDVNLIMIKKWQSWVWVLLCSCTKPKRSGAKMVVALREGSPSAKKAEAEGSMLWVFRKLRLVT